MVSIDDMPALFVSFDSKYAFAMTFHEKSPFLYRIRSRSSLLVLKVH